MSKDKQKIIPELRFSEFENDAEWELKSLNNLGEFKNGVNFSPKQKGKGVLTADVLNMFGDSIELSLTSLYRVDVDTKDFCLEFGDLLFVRSSVKKEGVGWTTYFNENDEPVLFCGFLIRLRLYSLKKVNPIFLTYYLRTDSLRRKIIALGGAAAITNISQDSLKSINVFIPKGKEQQKIANCFSSIDTIITVETEKLTLLKDHKKGLLQQLFPQEGETKPQYRFSEFKNDGDWVETILDDVADYANGKAHEKEISETGKYKVVNSKFISTDGQVVKFTNSVNLKANIGDILMVLSDVPNGKAIAKCFYVDEEDTYTVNQRICKITPTDIDNKFLFYIQNRNKYFLAFDDGVKQTNLRKDTVLSFPFLKPKDLKEQEKIADCLSSVDDSIESQTTRIEALKDHKKGLMQKLFPNINTM